MKMNTNQVISTTLAVAVIAGLGSTKSTGNFAAGIAVGVAYLAAAALVGMVASSYRGNPRNYSA